MKNQYFGDLNDYRKYSLLRHLSGAGSLRIAVCWMLTADDGRTDGSLIRYLCQPDRWRRYDPELFDSLNACFQAASSRDLQWAESRGLIPGAVYYSSLLADGAESRSEYFHGVRRIARGCDVLFFDPDNGIAVQSVPYGRRGSAKYLYEEELASACACGCSVLVFQHFPRVSRDPYIRELSQRILRITGASELLVFQTPAVLYLLISQGRHRLQLLERSGNVAERWGSQIRCTRWIRPRD
jgi:hypothetical protein